MVLTSELGLLGPEDGRQLAEMGRMLGRNLAVLELLNFVGLNQQKLRGGTVRRDGKGGIPVESRCKCGHPDRDCTENNRFCSAKSTKSEIGAKVGKCR